MRDELERDRFGDLDGDEVTRIKGLLGLRWAVVDEDVLFLDQLL